MPRRRATRTGERGTISAPVFTGADAGDDGAEDPPHRQCAVTRERLEREELIRFVADPSGRVVPDLKEVLPGRGVWIGNDRARVEKAAASGAFARSLKRAVGVDPDLADQVERLMRRRALEALSIANKAGELVLGSAKIEEAIERKPVIALLHGSDAAADGCRKLDGRLAAHAGVGRAPPTIARCFSIAEMSLALGRSNVVHAAVIDGGAGRRVLAEFARLERYTSGPLKPIAAGATKDDTGQA